MRVRDDFPCAIQENETPDRRLGRLLAAWSSTALVERRLGGGNRNQIWSVRIAGRRYAARLSDRSEPALDWEVRLLEHLQAAGMTVPAVLHTQDGRSRVDGLVVFSWLEGRSPESEREWRLVAAELDRLHALTSGWPQRPTFRSSLELLRNDTGGDVRLDLMPPEVVERVREAWRVMVNEPLSVIHGDPGLDNIRLQGGRVGLIDWDEARVDVSLLDLASLPLDLAPAIDHGRLARARHAALAWEVANGWVPEPEYARRRLVELESAR
jgi:Ser/Thr protein kinase RdoA (MazF antagonist)